jgi:hypothetical protein
MKISMCNIILLAAVFGMLFGRVGYAQDISPVSESPDSILRVTMIDGSVFIGVLVSETPQTISLETRYLGTINLSRNGIQRMDVLDSAMMEGGESWFENPNSTRYLFGP